MFRTIVYVEKYCTQICITRNLLKNIKEATKQYINKLSLNLLSELLFMDKTCENQSFKQVNTDVLLYDSVLNSTLMLLQRHSDIEVMAVSQICKL